MENSPPGIQTIPTGDEPGAVREFETVGANVIEPTNGQASHAAVSETGVVVSEGDLDVRIESNDGTDRDDAERNKPKSLAVNPLLGTLVVAISGFLCFFISPPK